MKKLSLLLALLLTLALLTACSGGTPATKAPEASAAPAESAPATAAPLPTDAPVTAPAAGSVEGSWFVLTKTIDDGKEYTGAMMLEEEGMMILEFGADGAVKGTVMNDDFNAPATLEMTYTQTGNSLTIKSGVDTATATLDGDTLTTVEADDDNEYYIYTRGSGEAPTASTTSLSGKYVATRMFSDTIDYDAETIASNLGEVAMEFKEDGTASLIQGGTATPAKYIVLFNAVFVIDASDTQPCLLDGDTLTAYVDDVPYTAVFTKQ